MPGNLEGIKGTPLDPVNPQRHQGCGINANEQSRTEERPQPVQKRGRLVLGNVETMKEGFLTELFGPSSPPPTLPSTF